MAIFVDGPEPFSGMHNRLLGEQPRQVSKKSDQWSRRRCDKNIVTELSSDFKDGRRSAIFVEETESFSGGYIQTLRGIQMQGFGEIPPVVSEEMRKW